MKIKRFMIGLAVAGLVACGPAEVDQAAQEAASAAGIAVPSGAAEEAASVAAQVGEEAVNLLSSAELEAIASEAMTTIQNLTPSDLRLQSDQALVLDTTQEVAGVSNYRWIVTDVPAGAEAVEGAVISENSNGKLTIEPSDYNKYFPVAGNYTVTLELTYGDGTKERAPIPIAVP